MRPNERTVLRVASAAALGSASVSLVGFGVSPKQSSRKARQGETPSPTGETPALPGLLLAMPD